MPKRKPAPCDEHRDPRPYDGPIERADGTRPFNMHLWPTEGDWFWADRDLGRHIDSRWNFHVIALADTRWSTAMSVYAIERGVEFDGRVVVFPTRVEALRASAARMIKQARNSRRWPSNVGGLSDAACAEVINWALEIAGRTPKRLRPIEKPRQKTGLPIFDHGLTA